MVMAQDRIHKFILCLISCFSLPFLMICTNQARRNGSCLTKASAVKWQLIPLINPQPTFHWHLNRHFIDNLIDSQSTLNRHLGWHSSDSCLIVARVSFNSYMYVSINTQWRVCNNKLTLYWLSTDTRRWMPLVYMIWKNYNNDDQFGN